MKMNIIKGYTPIQNRILLDTRISAAARILLCIIIMHCGPDNNCFPGQDTLAKESGYTDRHIRNLLGKLINIDLIFKNRYGHGQNNTYLVPKELLVKRDRNSSSGQLGNTVPLHKGNPFPTKSIHTKVKDKSGLEGIEILRKFMKEKGLK